MVRRLSVLALISGAMLLGIAPANAQVLGNCSVAFNGVDADRIHSLSSPLELDTGDTLIFAGTDPSGTRTARVRIIIGPVTLESNTTTYATPMQEFQAAIPLEDVSPYGVGLFRAEGTTEGCTVGVWIRVSGRFPLATLTGLTAMGLALGGITGQLGAIASRRRWARSAAALGGVATGGGLTLIGQEFGRLQLSYPSLIGMTVAVGGLGFILASLFNPAIRQDRRQQRATRLVSRPDPEPAPSYDADPSPGEPAPQPVAGVGPSPDDFEYAEKSPTGSRATTEPLPKPTPPSGPYWCYVLAPTDVFDLTDHTKTVAKLTPGSWYLAKRTLGGWVHVVAAEGNEGWVAEGAVHRQG